MPSLQEVRRERRLDHRETRFRSHGGEGDGEEEDEEEREICWMNDDLSGKEFGNG